MTQFSQTQKFRRLQETHKKWQQLQAKGQLKMKMKIDKDKKQYYDFDFSRYQYYYNYPKDHFSFLPPFKQTQLFTKLLSNVLQTQNKLFKHKKDDSQTKGHKQYTFEDNSQPLMTEDNSSGTKTFLNFDQSYQNHFFSYLKPYELQNFIHNFRQKIKDKIICLRIKKSLLTPKKVNELFKNSQKNRNSETAVQLIQTQIRTFLSKLNRINQYKFQFNDDIAKRFQQKKSHLQMMDRDELHSSPVEKSDMIIYQRLIKTDFHLNFNLRCISYDITLVLKFEYPLILRKAYSQVVTIVKSIEQKQKIQFQLRKQIIMKHLTQKQPHFLQDFTNLSTIDQFLKQFNYLTKLGSISPKKCLNANVHFEDIEYIPSHNLQLKELTKKVCSNHFTEDLIKNLIEPQLKQNYSQQHLSYKMTKLGSTLFRICQQTYDLTTKYQDRDILTKKLLMQRQLQTVFSNDIQKLLNMQEHQSITLVQSDYPNSYQMQMIEQKIEVKLSQTQLIYEKYFQLYDFKDPLICSLSNLLHSRKQKNFHDVIAEYTKDLKKNNSFCLKLRYLLVFYNNLHSDPKNHLINVINKKLSLGEQEEPKGNVNKFLSILQKKAQQKQEQVSLTLLNSVYFLRMISTLINKNKLLNVINGQVNIMLKVKNRLNFLKRKSNLKFQLSKQFITRYTQTNEKLQDPFNFLRDVQTLDDKVSYQIPKDKLFIQQKFVYVKRTNPQNPLFQGRKIIYEESISQMDRVLDRIIKLASKIIELRQNYLAGEELTKIVDRVELLYSLIECQLNYQISKIKLLNQYFAIFQKTIDPKGIQLLTEKIYFVKRQEFAMSLNQNSFIQEYRLQTKNLQLKSNILNKIILMQIKKQQNHIIQISNGLIRRNYNQHSPQISSIFYSEGNSVEQIQEQSDQQMDINEQRLKFQSDSQVKSQANFGNNSILETSQYSGTNQSYKFSDYHLKKSFKQILGLNQTSAIKSNIQKKEQMLNRKKKKIFNDSILGKLFNFSTLGQTQIQKSFYSEHIYHSIEIITLIESEFEKDLNYKYLIVQNSALEQILKNIINFEQKSLKYEHSFSQELLSLSLHECSKTLSKFVQKIKSHPSSIDRYNCFDPILIQNILKNSVHKEVNQYRGLYLALNHVQMTQILYQSQITNYRQIKLKKYLQSIVQQYSTYKIGKQQLLLSENILQNIINPQFKFFQTLSKANQLHFIIFGQYNTYAKQLFLLDSIFLQFYQRVLFLNFDQNINKFQNLSSEMQLVSKANCWFGDGSLNKLNQFSRIQNKVWVTKKIDSLKQYKKSLLNKQFLTQFFNLPNKIISENLTQKYLKKKINQSENILTESLKLRQFLQNITGVVCKVLILNWNLQQKITLNKNNKIINLYLKILPYLDCKIKINEEQSRLLRDVFFQQIIIANDKIKQNIQNSEKPSFLISSIRLKPSFLQNICQGMINASFKSLTNKIFNSIMKRQNLQFKSEKQTQNKRRQTVQFFKKNHQIANPFNYGKRQMKNLIQQTSMLRQKQYVRVKNMRRLIQIRLILFGCELTFEQLIKFRILLQDSNENFNIFWKDQTSNLIQSRQFVKLRNFKLQSTSLIQRYKKQYLQFGNLKQRYKQMIDKMIDIDLEVQLQDTIYLLIICLFYFGLQKKVKKTYLVSKKLNFLHNYGDEQRKPDQIHTFIQNVLKQKISLKNILKDFDFSLHKKIVFQKCSHHRNWSQFREFQERNRYLRYHMNHLKRANDHNIKNQLLHFKFQKLVFTNILKNCDIETESHKMKLQIFSKTFIQKCYQNSIYLNSTQKFVFDLSPKDPASKSKLESLKDQALENIYFIKYFQKILLSKMYDNSIYILNQQLELKKILGDSFQQRELNKDNKIIHESLNKVLAPKVMLNPFLNSPLLLDNYFFAGALKLSYIDQFLNKLKNRAIMVELAEGGFGFLLKIAELDQSVNALCKGVISYSEKQFNDRLRTYFEYSEQLRQNLIKTRKQNQHLRIMNKLHSFYDQKQIKSIIYEKLNKYLDCLSEKQKNYQSLFDMFKSLQNKIMKQCDSKYQKRITDLQKENQLLKITFNDFQNKIKQSSLTNINESKDVLYNQFKQKTQKILNKEFMPNYQEIQKSPFKQKQSYQSQILLEKLHQKNVFSKIKIGVLKTNYEKRIKELQLKLAQKDNFFQLLKQEKLKNQALTTQVNFLSHKAIEVQALQKKGKIDLEERMMQKFKLLRINQSIQGKLQNYQNHSKQSLKIKDFSTKDIKESEFKKTQQSVFITKNSNKRSHTEFGMSSVQKDKRIERSLHRIKKRSFVAKSQSKQSQSFNPVQMQYQTGKLQNIDEGKIWRERWQKSETKYQKLSNMLKSMSENYKLSKNSKKVCEKLLQIVDEANNNNSNSVIKKHPTLNQIL